MWLGLPKDVIDRPTIPTDPEEKFAHHSEWLVGAALTQTYDYMVENSLEYSYLTTGEAFVLENLHASISIGDERYPSLPQLIAGE